ncbi:hypothetical protein SKAU_G00191100 [Synaphobranchus kaupii]|uniref:CEP170 C-terminal domain-containing protein n=1 Tax=Synaphobranchus kaupii TaxID=118154 RepID=A0A9Q1FDR0_SYNKA|nr:hypothetical protein SKAU_G00191100 [Synaphobranchus kaupii]
MYLLVIGRSVICSALTQHVHSHVYTLERSQHHVPEEALKHEKYTSHLHMGLKPPEGKRPEPPDGASDPLRSRQDKSDRRPATEAPVSGPTPLYGQPSWWGEDDGGNKGRHGEGRRPNVGHPESPKEGSALDSEIGGPLSDYRVSQGKSIYSYGREPSYFEIPTKEFQARPTSPDLEVQEIPTKDTDAVPLPLPSPTPALATPTPPVMQSHASFTIEFDDCTPGKIKIKDHVTKFSLRQHKPPGRLQATTPTEVMSAESKVADWLVHTDISMMRKRATCEDACSTKSDLAMHIKTLKGHHHDDGTQSDSEDPVLKGKRSKSQKPDLPPQPAPPHKPVQPRVQLPRQLTPPTPPALKEPPCHSPPGSASPPQSLGKPPAPDPLGQQAFVIEFFDDNPRKKRSQSFTHNSAHAQADTYSALKAKLERRKGAAPSTALPGQIPPTQQVTIPLKGQGHSGPQRASSLHREKADERAGGSSGVTIKPFGSLGKNSKLAPRTPAQAATPVQAPVPPLMPLGVAHSVDPKTSKAVRGEEEDSLSDAGTYTIETESQDKEVEEARDMIDQVFGVLDSPEYTGVSTATYRPVIKERDDQGSPRHGNIGSFDPKVTPPQGLNATTLSGAPTGPLQVEPSSSATSGGPKWVSRWASLADSYSDSVPPTGLLETPPQVDSTDGDGKLVDQEMPSSNSEGPEIDGSQGLSRARRLLPQLPPSEKSESAVPAILILPDPYTSHQAAERGPGPLLQLETGDKLPIQEDLDPDSLSDTSRSDDGPGVRRRGRSREQVTEGGAEQEGRGLQEGAEEGAGPGPAGIRSTSFYIGSEQGFPRRELARSPILCPPEREQDVPHKLPPIMAPSPAPAPTPTRHPVGHEPRKLVKSNVSAPNLQTRERDSVSAKELSIIRQESFTKDRPSNNVQLNRLPHISSHPSLSDLDPWGPDGDTIPPLPRAPGRGTRQGLSPGHADDSLSGDSDVDTASTISLVSSKNAPAATAPLKKRAPAATALQKDKSSSSPSVRDQARQPTARERLSEKRRTQAADVSGKPEPVKRFQLRRSTGNRGSLDLSDHQQSWAGAAASSSSDHESGSRPGAHRKPTVPLQKDDCEKASKTTVQQALIRSNSLSAPRPTRASLLRRARLGETSDNEGGDTDRASQGSDVGVPGRPPADGKKLSRLDMLAMPRKRSGSFTAPSEPEPNGGRGTGSSRKTVAPEPKPGSVGRQPIIRARSSSAKYPSAASSRRRPDYTSTSEEEYEASAASTKHKRPHNSAATQTAGSQRHAAAPAPAQPRPVHRRTEQAEEEPDHESDAYQHWSTHSAEIARLSQDLAKDLAILAREIHDVAGDGDSPSGSAVGGDTSSSSTPNTPASNVSAREEQRTCPPSRVIRSSQLVQHIPEASLNYQKVPPGSAGVKDPDPDVNMNNQDLSTKHRPWNHEEVVLDNLMLSPVSQLSQAIRENTEQLAEKMKSLFHNKTEVWAEIEAKINAENEVPILKTSNKEISSILKELRRVQKQLEVINTIIEPGANPELVARVTPAAGKAKTFTKDSRPLSQTRRMTGVGASSASNANERAKGATAGSERERFAA